MTVLLGGLADHPGQERALEAIRFAVELPHAGFNLFILGRAETGKLEATSSLLASLATERPAGDDLCYVNNFDDPARPCLIRMAAGQGPRLRDDVAQMVEELSSAIPAMFESDDYQARVAKIDAEFTSVHEDALGKLIAEAREQGVAL